MRIVLMLALAWEYFCTKLQIYNSSFCTTLFLQPIVDQLQLLFETLDSFIFEDLDREIEKQNDRKRERQRGRDIDRESKREIENETESVAKMLLRIGILHDHSRINTLTTWHIVDENIIATIKMRNNFFSVLLPIQLSLSNYCDSNSCHSFTLLKALAKSNGNLFRHRL